MSALSMVSKSQIWVEKGAWLMTSAAASQDNELVKCLRATATCISPGWSHLLQQRWVLPHQDIASQPSPDEPHWIIGVNAQVMDSLLLHCDRVSCPSWLSPPWWTRHPRAADSPTQCQREPYRLVAPHRLKGGSDTYIRSIAGMLQKRIICLFWNTNSCKLSSVLLISLQTQATELAYR